jgi:hypothetical protein
MNPSRNTPQIGHPETLPLNFLHGTGGLVCPLVNISPSPEVKDRVVGTRWYGVSRYARCGGKWAPSDPELH